jgi:hypothetical protein
MVEVALPSWVQWLFLSHTVLEIVEGGVLESQVRCLKEGGVRIMSGVSKLYCQRDVAIRCMTFL